MYRHENVLFPDESNSQNKKKSTPKRDNAVSRLMRDLKEWNVTKNEFPCIDACPLDSNIFEWHCNICPESGNFRDIIFHLIIHFSKKYPLEAPEIELCTTMPHPNVFGGWICLDMIKRYEQGRYKGWTSAYSVTSLLMQLQSFLFEEGNVDQMEGYTVQRNFNKERFEISYLPNIKSFKCIKCKHCWDKPFPVPLSVTRRKEEGTFGKAQKSLRKIKYHQERKRKLRLQMAQNAGYSIDSIEEKLEDDFDEEAPLTEGFAFWDGIYKDLEGCIFEFFNITDLLKLRRVSKRFECLVRVSKMIQKDSIRCWFHRVAALPSKELHIERADKIKDGDMEMLCLGYGVTPGYFENQATVAKLENQLFSKKAEFNNSIMRKIGHFSLIQKVDTSFDLLSSDAFNNFNIRKSVFKDTEFTHFLPLYLNKKHGEICMKNMKQFITSIWLPCGSGAYHPWLALHCVANTMKSLIVSVMNVSSEGGKISLHYSINILEAFFRLHHTLLGIYFHNKSELQPLLQHQLNLFFKEKSCRNKWCVPDYGIFMVYLTIWENPNKKSWNDIAMLLLDETFTRQVKWVLNKHSHLINSQTSRQDRVSCQWDTSEVSRRLFMFNYFFFKQCCKLGDTEHSLEEIFDEYNENFGFPKDNSLPIRLQAFVKKIQTQVTTYEAFFNNIEVTYPGFDKLSDWLLTAMYQSEDRGYHKPWLYTNDPNPKRQIVNSGLSLQDRKPVSVSLKTSNKSFSWGQQRTRPTNNNNNNNNINNHVQNGGRGANGFNNNNNNYNPNMRNANMNNATSWRGNVPRARVIPSGNGGLPMQNRNVQMQNGGSNMQPQQQQRMQQNSPMIMRQPVQPQQVQSPQRVQQQRQMGQQRMMPQQQYQSRQYQQQNQYQSQRSQYPQQRQYNQQYQYQQPNQQYRQNPQPRMVQQPRQMVQSQQQGVGQNRQPVQVPVAQNVPLGSLNININNGNNISQRQNVVQQQPRQNQTQGNNGVMRGDNRTSQLQQRQEPHTQVKPVVETVEAAQATSPVPPRQHQSPPTQVPVVQPRNGVSNRSNPQERLQQGLPQMQQRQPPQPTPPRVEQSPQVTQPVAQPRQQNNVSNAGTKRIQPFQQIQQVQQVSSPQRQTQVQQVQQNVEIQNPSNNQVNQPNQSNQSNQSRPRRAPIIQNQQYQTNQNGQVNQVPQVIMVQQVQPAHQATQVSQAPQQRQPIPVQNQYQPPNYQAHHNIQQVQQVQQVYQNQQAQISNKPRPRVPYTAFNIQQMTNASFQVRTANNMNKNVNVNVSNTNGYITTVIPQQVQQVQQVRQPAMVQQQMNNGINSHIKSVPHGLHNGLKPRRPPMGGHYIVNNINSINNNNHNSNNVNKVKNVNNNVKSGNVNNVANVKSINNNNNNNQGNNQKGRKRRHRAGRKKNVN